MVPDAGFGIYLHWPYCEAKCPYCDFNSYVSASVDQDAWRDAYLREVDRYAAEFPDRIVRSVFFGGGTPSLMDPATVAEILDRISTSWRFENRVEVTLEANPSSVERDRFEAFKQAGVNRVSLGVQSLNDEDLRRLGRVHSAEDALKALDVARSVFDRASFDLIYARQHQTPDAWRNELSNALSFGFDHLSLYQLTIEDGTAFGDRHARGKLAGLPNDDHSADMYEMTVSMCAEAGLSRYEVSNFALPKQESAHNQIYWAGGDYLGLGPGAHGRLRLKDGERAATETYLVPRRWLAEVTSTSGESGRAILSNEDQLTELLVMGLRTTKGVNLSRLQSLDSTRLVEKNMSSLMEDGVVEIVDGYLSIKPDFLMLTNSVLEKLVKV